MSVVIKKRLALASIASLFLFVVNQAPVVAGSSNDVRTEIQSTQILHSVKAGVNKKRPRQNAKVSAYCVVKDQSKKPIVSAKCNFAWKYKSITQRMSATTGKKGKARVKRKIGLATKGYKVRIHVTAKYKGVTKKATTGFTPR